MSSNYPEDKNESALNRKMSRRKAISTAGKAAIGVGAAVVVGGAAYYALTSGQNNSSTSTTTSSANTTSSSQTSGTVSSGSSALQFVDWLPAWFPNIMTKLNSDYPNENSQLVTLPGDWDLVMESRFASGQPVDVLNCQGGQGARWRAAGWIQDLNEWDQTAAYKASVFPKVVQGSTMTDGSFIGYNYYVQNYALFRNEALLKQIGQEGTTSVSDYPQTWDDVFNICMELKQKGISNEPYLPTWVQAVYGLPWDLYQNCFAMGDTMIDENLDATFDTTTGIMDVFTNYKRFWDAGLIPQGALTMSATDMNSAWQSGQYAFNSWLSYQFSTYQDPTQSKTGGVTNLNPVWPGSSNNNFALVSLSWASAAARGSGQPGYRATPYTSDQQTRVQNLLGAIGGKYPTTSTSETIGPIEGTSLPVIDDFWQASTFFFLNMNGNPFTSFWSDPSVMAHVTSNMYPPVASTATTWWINQLMNADLFNGFRAPWWSQWETQMMSDFADVMQGNITISDEVTNLRSLYDSLQKSFGS